jgi:hypothetical protein
VNINLNILIGMAVLSVGSSFLESYLNKAGKIDEARYASMFTVGAIGTTAVTSLVTLVKALRSLV